MLRSNYLLLISGCCLVFAVSAQIPITPRSCPANETFLACGPDCQTECATLGKPCLVRHIRCPDGCYCNKGFARQLLSSAGHVHPPSAVQQTECPERN
ncbi:GD24198 [Drosophila simulans]|uniref:GD24198 n=1 Tax=Drosophila simulans TaxID=7240 RepID=B4NUW9_DROSI|nr:GD24198 [Drosophila simulans]